MNALVLISGCSGGGKSTLLDELARRGFPVVEEPGRRIVKRELETGGNALPWTDMVAFAHSAIEMAKTDYATARSNPGWTFFDRGLVDAALALQHTNGQPIDGALISEYRYYQKVFLTPPWPEIYSADPERRHGFEDAVEEYERLSEILPKLGYEIVLLPKVDVHARAEFLLKQLSNG